MDNIRLFIAIPVPGPVKAELAKAQKILVDANPNLRSVSLPGIHLTLKFLGDTPENRIPDIRRAMEQAVNSVTSPIHLSCRGTGAFPNLKAPRVLWAGLSGDTEPLGGLCRTLEKEMAKAGFAEEERPFHPHLTLARLKTPKMLGALHKAWNKVENLTFGDFVAEALVLYRSELKPSGAVYTSIERIVLPGE